MAFAAVVIGLTVTIGAEALAVAVAGVVVLCTATRGVVDPVAAPAVAGAPMATEGAEALAVA